MNTLYTVLTKSKNDICYKFNPHQIPKTPLYTSKPKVIECFKQHPPLNTFHSHEMYNKVVQNQITEVPLLSNKEYLSSLSERERYQRFYSELYTLKSYIEANRPKEKTIIKDFLMNNKIYNSKYYTDDKIENFLSFIKAKTIEIDSRKLFKDVLKDALNYGCYNLNTKTFYKNNTNNNNSSNSNSNNTYSNKQLLLKTYLNKFYTHKQPKKNVYSVVDTRQKMDLVNNMELQKNLYDKKSQVKHQIDLNKRPTLVIDLLKDDFVDRKRVNIKGRPRNLDWDNERLYGNKKIEIDYNILKKENKITDYICLLKARNNYNLTQITGNIFYNKNKKDKKKNSPIKTIIYKE